MGLVGLESEGDQSVGVLLWVQGQRLGGAGDLDEG